MSWSQGFRRMAVRIREGSVEEVGNTKIQEVVWGDGTEEVEQVEVRKMAIESELRRIGRLYCK